MSQTIVQEKVPVLITGVSRHKFTREDYYRMGELGLFENQRVELIGGEIIDMTPADPEHSVTKGTLSKKWLLTLEADYYVRIEDPLTIGESEPQPDIAIVRGSPDEYRTAHPTTALLVIEISNTSLDYDRTVKMSLYASAIIPEYWIVNLKDRCLEVYRDPEPAPDFPFEARYRTRLILTGDQMISPLFKPDITLRIADWLS